MRSRASNDFQMEGIANEKVRPESRLPQNLLQSIHSWDFNSYLIHFILPVPFSSLLQTGLPPQALYKRWKVLFRSVLSSSLKLFERPQIGRASCRERV